jgi:Flp pilus assembly protein TadG
MRTVMQKRYKGLLSKFIRADRGIAAIEFAFIFPAMAMMYFGMLDLTTFITTNRKVTNAAAVAADLVTANDGSVLGTQISDYYNAPDIIMAPMPNSKVRVEFYDFKISGGAVSQRWALNNGRGTSCGAAPSAASFSSMMAEGNDILVARVCTTYQPFFGQFTEGLWTGTMLGNASITLTKNIYERPRLSKELLCYATVVNGTLC